MLKYFKNKVTTKGTFEKIKQICEDGNFKKIDIDVYMFKGVINICLMSQEVCYGLNYKFDTIIEKQEGGLKECIEELIYDFRIDVADKINDNYENHKNYILKEYNKITSNKGGGF